MGNLICNYYYYLFDINLRYLAKNILYFYMEILKLDEHYEEFDLAKNHQLRKVTHLILNY